MFIWIMFTFFYSQSHYGIVLYIVAFHLKFIKLFPIMYWFKLIYNIYF